MKENKNIFRNLNTSLNLRTKLTYLLFIVFVVSLFHFTYAQSFQSRIKAIYHDGWIDLNKNGKKDIYEDPAQPVERRIDDLLSQMTLEEKTCQMATLYGYHRVLKDSLPTPAWKNEIWKDGIANIDEHLNGFIGWRKATPDLAIIKDIKKHVWAMNTTQAFSIEDTRLGVPVNFTDEGIRGVEAYGSTDFPTQLALGNTWDKALLHYDMKGWMTIPSFYLSQTTGIVSVSMMR